MKSLGNESTALASLAISMNLILLIGYKNALLKKFSLLSNKLESLVVLSDGLRDKLWYL